jgi:DNA-binding protein YbaB
MTTSDNVDPDRLAAEALAQLRQVEDFQARSAAMVGIGEALGGLVRAEATGADGLTAIDIDPRAMRSSAYDLSQAALEAARGALADLQRQTLDAMRGILGDEITDVIAGTGDPLKLVNEAEHQFKSSLDDALGALDKIRRQSGY